jgi:polar amino acid transport system substrate-binding protein
VKRYSYLFLALVLALTFILSACQAKPTETPAAYPPPAESTAPQTGYPAGGTVVRIATDATFPPFETVDETTKDLVGFDIDLMNAIADKEGLTLEWTNTPFDSVISGVVTCQFDAAIAAITITEDRQNEMLFSQPYINAGQIVVVAMNNEVVKSVADLAGKTVAAQLGSTGEIEAKKIPDVVYKPYDTYDLAFLDLINGQVDAVIADYPTALAFIGANENKIKTVGDVFTNESYGIAICKEKTDLQATIDAGLQAVIADGKVKELETQWLAGQ